MSWRDFFRRPTNPSAVSSNDFSDAVPSQALHDTEPDILILLHRRNTYELHFPPYAIDEGRVSVGDLRQRAAEVTYTPDVQRIKLLYKGKLLNDDTLPCRDEGLKQQSDVLCVVSGVQPSKASGTQSSEVSSIQPSKASGKRQSKVSKKQPAEVPRIQQSEALRVVSGSQPVVELTEACRSAFNQCLTYGDLQKDQWAENRLADFILWADGVGALAASRASLDSRFHSQPSGLILVKGTLVMLHGFLDQCIQCVKSGSPVSEATRNVDSALENLALLAVAVRRTGRRSRLEKADRKFDPEDHLKLEHLLRILCLYRPGADIHNEEVLAKLRTVSVAERVLGLRSTTLSSPQERLLQTNLRRRNRFLQAQRHSEGLKSRQWDQREIVYDTSERHGAGTEAVAKAGQEYTASQQPRPQLASSSPIEPTISGTSASIPESKLNDQTAKRQSSQMAITTVTTLTAAARYPRPPKLQEGARMFKCPCCCQTLPVDIAIQETRWKKHLSEDINPYTCLLEDCPTPFATYATEHDWENHVKNKHAPRRLCPFCQDMSTIFLSMEAFLEHVQVNHAQAVSESLMMAVMSHSGVVTIGVTNCPLCASSGPESDPIFIRHVLQCMHDFSLRSLPWAGNPPGVPRPVGTYNLGTAEYEGISRWLESLDQVEESRLQLSEYDDVEVSHESDVEVHFENNAYFDLESAQDSIEALERSSKSFSQQEADFDNADLTDSAPLPFPIPSYLKGSQHMARLEAAYRGVSYFAIGQIENSELLPLPSRWNDGDKEPGFKLTNEGVGVQYSGRFTGKDHEAAAIRADSPISSQCGIYYFEIEILSVSEEGMVAIGFSSTKASVERLPGWEMESWAYHSDDGKAFFGESQGQGRQYGPTFGKNDTVGCGVDFEAGRAFFTKNGVFLGHAFRDLPVQDLKIYPAVGSKRLPIHIVANFGERPFVYDIDRHVERNAFPINQRNTATGDADSQSSLSHSDYQIGLICALPIEMAAVMLMLDKEHPSLPQQPTHENSYALGKIGEHNVVITCQKSGSYVFEMKSRMLAELKSDFPSLQFCIMVGVGSGVPSKEHDIWLGDIVVGIPGADHGGLIQYDMGKRTPKADAERLRLNRPPRILLSAVSYLRAEHEMVGSQITEILSKAGALDAREIFKRPSLADCLYDAEYQHNGKSDTCLNCDAFRQIVRSPRADSGPRIHYGLIASSNQVITDPRIRDRLAEEDEVLCVEMEAAGIMDSFPCLMIRGIVDYADTHRNKHWQGYAAAVSAAYAKELLLVISAETTRLKS